MGKMSIATIKDPEFINLKPLDINPLMSSCEIKVLYTGGNRNGSFITKEVATEMSKTLRGAPIVGWFKEDKDDFGDHGDRVIIDGDGIKFETMTKPYGFVSPDAKVWFQEFEETDDFGNKVIREYLMTTGYIWDGQYKEAGGVTKDGKAQSMELESNSLKGHWSTDVKTNMEFFIITDAIFSKLCILGDDVEPCFEGASVTSPDISKNFSLDSDFKKNLFDMMQQLNFALAKGENMEGNINKEEFAKTEDEKEKESKQENQETKKEEEKEKPSTTSAKDEEKKSKCTKEEDDERYSLLEEKFSKLETQHEELKKEYQNLISFKKNVELEKKNDLIKNVFYMLSDEDKKPIVENIDKYSLEDIEKELSLICFRKKINFGNTEEPTMRENNTTPPPTTYNLDEHSTEQGPAWLNAVRKNKNKNN